MEVQKPMCKVQFHATLAEWLTSVQVKSYSRPAAGQHMPDPDELRPPDILYSTVCHLLTR